MSPRAVPDSAREARESGPPDATVAAIAAGDAEAFARWLAGIEHRLRASLRSFAAHVDTEGVIQEALLRVWLAAPRFEPDGQPNSLLRLAVRIARNLAVSELRRNRLDATEIDVIEREAIMAGELVMRPVGPGDPLLRQAIEECYRHLPPKPRGALRARVTHGGIEPDATLADRLGMRLNTFLQNVTRGRRMLAACLRRRGVDLEMELR